MLNPLLCLTYPHGELADDFFSPRDIILSVPLGCRRSLSSPFHHALHQPLITPRNFFLLTRHSRRYARFRLLCSIKKVSIPSKLWEGVLSFELDNTSSRRRLQGIREAEGKANGEYGLAFSDALLSADVLRPFAAQRCRTICPHIPHLNSRPISKLLTLNNPHLSLRHLPPTLQAPPRVHSLTPLNPTRAML